VFSLPAQRNIIEEDRPRHNYCTAEDASRKKPLLLPNVDVNCDDLEDRDFALNPPDFFSLDTFAD